MSSMNLNLACLCILSVLFVSCEVELEGKKVCRGTSGEMSVPSNRLLHYQNLRQRYTNCTHVHGNLELTWLNDKDLDLSFLDEIREVNGYVLIAHFGARRIVLPNLTIIRGQELLTISNRSEEFALLATFSGMDSLEMPSLRDISVGSAGFINNHNLCYVKSINWTNILSGPGGRFIYIYDYATTERPCPPCNNSCQLGCWGEGPENCQVVTVS